MQWRGQPQFPDDQLERVRTAEDLPHRFNFLGGYIVPFFQRSSGLKKALLAEALEVFFGLREVPGLKKKPSTSELLDWLKLLLAEDIPPEALRSKDRKTIIPPLHGALLKNEQDVHLFERLVFMTRAKGS